MIHIKAKHSIPYRIFTDFPKEEILNRVKDDLKFEIVRELVKKYPIHIEEKERKSIYEDAPVTEYVVSAEVCIPEPIDYELYNGN